VARKERPLTIESRRQMNSKFRRIESNGYVFISDRNMRDWYGNNSTKNVGKLKEAWQEYFKSDWTAPKLVATDRFATGKDHGYLVGRRDTQKDWLGPL
jgi:hypothetical protein